MVSLLRKVSNIFCSRVPVPTKLDELARQVQMSEFGFSTVTQTRAALQLSTVERCISVISNMAACIPVHVVKMTKGGYERVDRDHPAWWLLNSCSDASNPYADDAVPAFFWRQAASRQTLFSGNSCLPIDRNQRNQAVRLELQRVATSCKPAYGHNNERYYDYFDRYGRHYELTPFDVLHFRHAPPDGFIGVSPVITGSASMALSASAEDRAHQLMDDGRPAGFIQIPSALTPDNKTEIQESFRRQHTVEKHRVGVLTHGAEWKTFGFDAQALELLQTREFQVTELCRWFGVPPHLVFQGKEKSQNTAAQLLVEFLIVTMIPYLTAMCNVLESRLLTYSETHRAQYSLWFDRDALESADPTSFNATLIRRLQNGAMTINDWRDILRQPHVPYGDEPLIMGSQMVPLGTAVNPPENPAKDGNPTDPTKKDNVDVPTSN